MKEPIWVKQYEVNSYLLGPRKSLSFVGVLNLIQDAAWVHATHLGHGYESMTESGLIWVLTRQKLSMERWPDWGEFLDIKTWVRPIDGVLANRDFELSVKGEKVGECTTSWITLDEKTRKPQKIKNPEEFECRKDFQLSIAPRKVEVRKDLNTIASFKVRNSDLDLNKHVNNTRYAQWIIDSIFSGVREQFRLREYDVNFLAETRPEDEIAIEMSGFEALSTGEDQVQFQGRRISDETVVFAARLLVYRSFRSDA